MSVTPVYLCILDGFAVGKKSSRNAVYDAIRKGCAPYIKDLFDNHPYAQLECSGLAVGLPKGTMGNSEVNHLNMGAGRIVYQSIERINVAIHDGSFFKNQALLSAFNNCKQHNSTLHLMGVLQGHSGTVHGSIKHLFALLEMVKILDVEKVFLHIFTDGRDTDPHAAGEVYLKMLEHRISELELNEVVKIKSVMGREVVMDRDTSWNKTLMAFKALVAGETRHHAHSAHEAIHQSYKDGHTDEFIRPTVIGEYHGMGPNDSVIFWNYRQDRAIQLTVAFCETEHKYFNYKKGTKHISDEQYNHFQDLRKRIPELVFVAMTEYYPGQHCQTAFAEGVITETVGEVVSNAGLTQLRLAGPEKFVHVTGWFSGRRAEPFPGEDRHLPQDLTLKERTEEGKRYDLVPEMTAFLETDYALSAIKEKDYSLIVHNFQNGDMVGHTGNLDAAIEAIGDISACLEKLVPAWTSKGGVFIITADHGNSDEMLIRINGKLVKSTQHSMNPVPFFVLGKKVKLREQGVIPDVGVTVLDLMGLPKPEAMTAQTLIVH